MTHTWRHALLSLLLLALLSGCASRPGMRFYALSAEPASLPTAPAAAADLVLAVGPVDLPEYLRRPQIVSRPGGNRLLVDEFNRWGGILEEEISRTLTQNLTTLLGTQRIYNYPSRIVADTDLRVAIDVRSFDGELGGTVVVDAAWSLIDETSARVLATRQGVYRVAASGADYDSYAAALSDGLAQLSRDIAAAVAARVRPSEPPQPP
jgi:uncharacterized lipoprotein YmbA